MILDPFGEVLAESQALEDDVVVAVLTAEKIEQAPVDATSRPAAPSCTASSSSPHPPARNRLRSRAGPWLTNRIRQPEAHSPISSSTLSTPLTSSRPLVGWAWPTRSHLREVNLLVGDALPYKEKMTRCRRFLSGGSLALGVEVLGKFLGRDLALGPFGGTSSLAVQRIEFRTRVRKSSCPQLVWKWPPVNPNERPPSLRSVAQATT